MRRSLIYLAKLGIAVAVAIWLVENPGDLQVDWLGWRIETSFALFLVVVGIALWLLVIGVRSLLATLSAPGSFLRGRAERRSDRGYRALVQGMTAVALGDAEEARRLAQEADRLLQDPSLTRLLSAQAAALNGDSAAAAKYFAALRDNEDTAFLGLVGLMRQAIARGDEAHALELAEEAHALRPDAGSVATTRVYGLARARRWAEAQAALFDAVKRGLIERPRGRHHRAALLVERSRESDDRKVALDLASKARESVADFVPAITAEARLTGETGRRDRARKQLHTVWPKAPHPDLVAGLRDLWPGEAASLLFRKVQAMASQAPDHPESRLAIAEAALDAEFWGEARAQLAGLAPEDVGPRACRLWSRLEEEEHGNTEAARRWLERAAQSTGDPAWTCGSCGAVAPAWSAVCGNCGSFDTLDWMRPPRFSTLPAGAGEDADAVVVDLPSEATESVAVGPESAGTQSAGTESAGPAAVDVSSDSAPVAPKPASAA